MSEIVFILGAGASKEAGAPLMADFLNIAGQLLRNERCGDYQDDFKRVFASINELQQVQSKAVLDLDNFESVFGAFEMANLIQQLPGTAPELIPKVVTAMKRLITKTLEESIEFPHNGTILEPPNIYKTFGMLIKELNSNSRRASILTFNYDVIIDFALQHAGVPVNYCLDDQENASATKLLKLHGSLNWMMCSEHGCGQILPWHLDQYVKQPPFGSSPGKLQMGSNLRSSFVTHKETNHSTLVPGHEPVIVPPTWNKTEHHRSLQGVWRQAARELKEAESIIVIGYSLPDADAFFKYLYALSYVSSIRTARFCVFDPSAQVRERFKALLGQDASRKYQEFERKFGESIEIIRDLLPMKQGTARA